MSRSALRLALYLPLAIGFNRLGHAQAGFEHPVMAGQIVADQFGDWHLEVETPVPSPGVATIQVDPSNLTLPDSIAFNPLRGATAVSVVDGNRISTVPVVENACQTGLAPCQLKLQFPDSHPARYVLESASGGLQEAVSFALNQQGGTVLVNDAWHGTIQQLLAVQGAGNVLIHDTRRGGESWYGWNGQSYTLASQLRAGTDGMVSAGPLVNALAFGASGSLQTAQAVTTAGVALVTVEHLGDFQAGNHVALLHGGTPATVAHPGGLTVGVIGTSGNASYSYSVAALDGSGGESAVSAVITVSSAPAALDDFHYTQLSWTASPGALGYAIYGRTTSNPGVLAVVNSTTWADHGTLPGGIPDTVAVSPPSQSLATTLLAKLQNTGAGNQVTFQPAPGATGSGLLLLHDDGPSIAAAIQSAPAGATLLLPGQHRIFAPLTIPKPLTITGNLVTGDSGVANLFLASSPVGSVGAGPIVFRDITLSRDVSQADDGYQSLIFVEPGTDLRVLHCTLRGGFNGIAGIARSLLVAGNLFDTTMGSVGASNYYSRGGAAVLTDANSSLLSQNITITDNVIRGGVGNGFSVFDAQRVVIEGNLVQDATAPRHFYPIGAAHVTAASNGTVVSVDLPMLFPFTSTAVIYDLSGTYLGAALVLGVSGDKLQLNAAFSVVPGDLVELRHAGGYGIFVYSTNGPLDSSQAVAIASVQSAPTVHLGLTAALPESYQVGTEINVASATDPLTRQMRFSNPTPHVLAIDANRMGVTLDLLPTATMAGDLLFPSALGRDVEISHNQVHDVDGFGIYVQGYSDAAVAGNVLNNVLRAGPMDSSLSWAGITLTQSNGSVVSGNSVRYTGTGLDGLYPGKVAALVNLKQRSPGIFLYGSSGTGIAGNTLAWLDGAGIRLGASDTEGGDAIGGNQVLHPGADGIYCSGGSYNGLSVVGNVIQAASGDEGVGIFSTFTGLQIEHNVVTGSAGRGLTVQPVSSGSGLTVAANTVINNGQSLAFPAVDLRQVNDFTVAGNTIVHPDSLPCVSVGPHSSGVIGTNRLSTCVPAVALAPGEESLVRVDGGYAIPLPAGTANVQIPLPAGGRVVSLEVRVAQAGSGSWSVGDNLSPIQFAGAVSATSGGLTRLDADGYLFGGSSPFLVITANSVTGASGTLLVRTADF